MACTLTHVWRGLQVWRELRRRAAVSLHYDLSYFHAMASLEIQRLADQAPKDLFWQLEACDPITSPPPTVTRILLGGLVLITLLYGISGLLGVLSPAIVETTTAPPGRFLVKLLVLLIVSILLYSIWRRIRNTFRFFKLLCILGQIPDLVLREEKRDPKVP